MGKHSSLMGSLVSCKDNEALLYTSPGNTDRGGRLSTVDLLIKVACFVKKEDNIFNIKMS